MIFTALRRKLQAVTEIMQLGVKIGMADMDDDNVRELLDLHNGDLNDDNILDLEQERAYDGNDDELEKMTKTKDFMIKEPKFYFSDI